MPLEIISTGDGSHTLKNTDLNETYHSVRGAIRESKHVFIQAGLSYVLEQKPDRIRIFEMGFGTGLNAYLTLLHQNIIPIEYTTIEAFPIGQKTIGRFNYPRQLTADPDLFASLHQAAWDQWVEIQPWFKLLKTEGSIYKTVLPENRFDLIYYDAFAPGKQPEMWGIPVLTTIANSMNQGSVLVTYCAQGQFKRNLRLLGLEVERLPGPPGKAEMVRAIK